MLLNRTDREAIGRRPRVSLPEKFDLTTATNAATCIHSAPNMEEGAMSTRLVFSLLIVTMTILLVWAFRPATIMFTGAAPTTQSDSLTQ